MLLVSKHTCYSTSCVFSGYKMDLNSVDPDEKVLMYQRYVEACKFANGLKQFVKDPKFYSDKVCRLSLYSQTS